MFTYSFTHILNAYNISENAFSLEHYQLQKHESSSLEFRQSRHISNDIAAS